MTLNKSQRAELFNKYGGRCAYCGCELPEKGWQADHLEPVYRESKYVRGEHGRPGRMVSTGKMYHAHNDHFANMMPSCRACNISKGVESLEDWRFFLQRLAGILRRNYSAFRHAERFGVVVVNEIKIVFYFEKFAGEPERGEKGVEG